MRDRRQGQCGHPEREDYRSLVIQSWQARGYTTIRAALDRAGM